VILYQLLKKLLNLLKSIRTIIYAALLDYVNWNIIVGTLFTFCCIWFRAQVPFFVPPL